MAEKSDDENEIEALTREIEKATKMRRALVKLKHRLETKLKIPCSATFKEYESFATVDQLKNNFACVDLASCRAKLELCLIAGGIKCVDVKSGQMRFELQFGVGPHIYSGYQIQIDEVESGGFRLAKYHLPEGLDVETIVQKVPMKDTPDMSIFLKFVRACSCALLYRRKQIEELKDYCASKSVDIDVFTSSDVTFLEIIFMSDILKLSSKTEKMSFILKYAIDAHLPISSTYEKEHINQEDKSPLDSYCSDFLTLNLVEAFRCVRHVKRQPEDNSKNLKTKPKQLKQGTLQFHAMIQNSKNSKDPVTSQRTQEKRVHESKSLVAPESSPPRRSSRHTQKFSEYNVESMPESTSTHTQKILEEEGESKSMRASPSRKSVHVQKFSDDDVESVPKNTSPRRVTAHTQKMPEQKVESRTTRASPRRKSIRVQMFSNDDESSSESTSPRRVSSRKQKELEEEVKSRPTNTSPKSIPTSSQKMLGEKVESRTTRTSSRRKSVHVQKFSDDESNSESTSPRRMSIRKQKVSEEEVKSRPRNTSPKHIPTSSQKMLREKVESRTTRTSPRRKSVRVQKFSDDESNSESTSPRHMSIRKQKVSEEEVKSRPRNTSPEHLPTSSQKMLREKAETTRTSRRKSIRVKKFSDYDENIRQAWIQQKVQMPTVAAVRIPLVFIPEQTPDHKKRNPHQRPFLVQKSSTPLRTGNTYLKQQSSDIDMDDLSTIIGSDTNVQSLSEENRNRDPVGASTPFVQPNIRQKSAVNTEKKLNSDYLETNSPQIYSHKYRQTRLHTFIKNLPLQTTQINKSIKISPRKKLIPEQYSSESDVDEDQKELGEMEKKRKSGINVHKSTPVPKGFRSSHMKKPVSQQSVVSGKRLRRKK